MRYILSSGSLYTYGLDRVFALAAEAGFDGIEVLVDMRFDTRQPAYLRRLVERHGTARHQRPRAFLAGADACLAARLPGSLAAAAELAADMGAALSSRTCRASPTARTSAGCARIWRPGSGPIPSR